ncbi:uncharacterized protein LOC126765838 [Bactrocera neohumeralis]|uniref:uncharacterized protein LOC126765838 n=1 Tax=Bactrocera neohumeralis TaxID=98809 RepID=UPI002165F9C2|nr:uncharacterized protein LOC126765838 [Bactrocera neohumeralis]
MPSNCRLRIFDTSTNITFLIDSGADVSVLPKCSKLARVNSSDMQLFAANSSPITVFGEVILRLNLNLRKDFVWSFVIADVTQAIIGADFLSHYDILPDLNRRCLLDRKTAVKSFYTVARINVSNISTISSARDFINSVREFSDVTRPVAPDSTTKSTLVHRKLDICRPSSSNWASPLHMVRKADGSWRPCGDYRALNAVTVPDKYPLPFLHDFSNTFAENSIFSKIDLQKAFHQIPIDPNDICKTAITTLFGLYEFTHITFGLRNAAQTFQRVINEVFRGIGNVFTYLDDICVASRSPEEHRAHLRIVFQRLLQHNLTINVAKSVLGVSELHLQRILNDS